MRLLLSILLIFILAFSLLFGVDESAMRVHDEAFERAMVAFGLAKGLNAIISLIQGTQLSFAPVGIGLSFSVGEVLDPLNDMVERFSWIMLGASVSLGIQKLLLVLSSKLFLQVALSLSIVLSLVFIWMKKIQNQKYFILSMRALALLIVLRFGALLFVYTSEIFYMEVLATDYKESSSVLQETKLTLEDIQSQNKTLIDSKKESAWYELDVSKKYDELKSQLNLSEKLDSVSKSIEEASMKIITLITIFIVQTVLLPLLYLWFLVFSVKYIFKVEFDELKVVSFLNR